MARFRLRRMRSPLALELLEPIGGGESSNSKSSSESMQMQLQPKRIWICGSRSSSYSTSTKVPAQTRTQIRFQTQTTETTRLQQHQQLRRRVMPEPVRRGRPGANTVAGRCSASATGAAGLETVSMVEYEYPEEWSR